MDLSLKGDSYAKTRRAYIWTHVLNTPFWAIFNMLNLILYKDLHATVWQVTALIALKPASSLIAMYWSAIIDRKKSRLLPNIIWARILSHLPFFAFPFISNPWYFVFCCGLYMVLARGAVPAWMEILKLNIPKGERENLFAYVSAFCHMGGAFLPIFLGYLLDVHQESWRYIFPVLALVSICGIFFKRSLSFEEEEEEEEKEIQREFALKLEPKGNDLYSFILKPWKIAWDLMKSRPDFMRFQIGFMLAGSGLIILQPAIPGFFVDTLDLSFTEMAFALTFFKGIGFGIGSPIWPRLLRLVNIYQFNGWVTFLAAVFPLCLIAAVYHPMFLYFGYILYGVMQGGSELSWNLSGPIFADKEESSIYSLINVLTVGLRGCIVPAIGTILLLSTTPTTVMLLCGGLCLSATIAVAIFSRHLKVPVSA